MLLDGWHLVHDAADAGLEITSVAVVDSPRRADHGALLKRLAARAAIVTVSRAVLDAMSPVRTPSGIVALARRRQRDFEDVLRPAPPLVVVAVDVQDPGNGGAILRSAEAGGATGVILTGASADPWNWKSLRASMGSTFRLPVVRHHSAAEVCDRLHMAQVSIYAAIPRHGIPMHQADLDGPTAVVLGGEGAGLPEDLLSRADEAISIPMRERVESLNVAVAAALLVYEARRQRQRS